MIADGYVVLWHCIEHETIKRRTIERRSTVVLCCQKVFWCSWKSMPTFSLERSFFGNFLRLSIHILKICFHTIYNMLIYLHTFLLSCLISTSTSPSLFLSVKWTKPSSKDSFLFQPNFIYSWIQFKKINMHFDDSLLNSFFKNSKIEKI